jgi:hypothetical protein
MNHGAEISVTEDDSLLVHTRIMHLEASAVRPSHHGHRMITIIFTWLFLFCCLVLNSPGCTYQDEVRPGYRWRSLRRWDLRDQVRGVSIDQVVSPHGR